MFRDRTNLFLSYRRTFPHNIKYTRTNTLDKGGLLESQDDTEDFQMVDMSPRHMSDVLPPHFVDLTLDIDEYLVQVERLMSQLTKLYRKNSLPGFQDKSHDENEIEDISYKVIQLFQKCYNVMKKLQHVFESQHLNSKQLQKGELIILDNLQKRYAQKIQQESSKFRVLQNNYLKFLNKDDLTPLFPKNDGSSQLLLEEEAGEAQSDDIEAYSRKTLQRQQTGNDQATQRFLRERDEEITQLANSVLEVSTIFREMQNLIIDQGTIVDRIDYNLENTVIDLKEANQELNKATHYQKRTQKCKIILLLSLCVLALFLIVMLKPHGSSSSSASPVVAPKPAEQIPETPGSTSSTGQVEVNDDMIPKVMRRDNNLIL
ncbi:hypothetical protein HG535_0C04410 [Zygotorulaspora mrakii]|uniref:t-SNARE coiled-coil homology domain-containing protein n=1 Tax=Zygotorulaspora mrakii TaxID=42260 RepID=A0A7H9B0S8_ZYGMR|nr:uncharacterized protein HG535_0C04410 [Zygotorulaspora mrakii]QLG72087.1 hypothetical protein HG535_0C04410 [Zygotorulaspora mrakii]